MIQWRRQKLFIKIITLQSRFWTFIINNIFISHLLLCVDFLRLCLHVLALSLSSNILLSLSPISPPTQKRLSSIRCHLNLKWREFETMINQITNSRIQPLLSMKVERPENLTFDQMKYEFSKPFCPPNKTDIGSDEEWATEPDITLQKKVCIKGILRIFWLYKCLSNILVILFNSGDSWRFANHHKRDETNTLL